MSMNRTEDVTIELADDGMIIRRPASSEIEAECYLIPDVGRYSDAAIEVFNLSRCRTYG